MAGRTSLPLGRSRRAGYCPPGTILGNESAWPVREAPGPGVGRKADGVEKGRNTRLDREGTPGHPLRFNSVYPKSYLVAKCSSQHGPSMTAYGLFRRALVEIWGTPAGIITDSQDMDGKLGSDFPLLPKSKLPFAM